VTSKSPKTPEVVYGVAAISKVVDEPNERRVNYWLSRGRLEGAWKQGNIWALTVPVWRRSVGLDAE
jgi:hypothetical protein